MDLDVEQVHRFQRVGYVVLRQALDPTPLTKELNHALDDAYRFEPQQAFATGGGGVRYRYVPMMCETTPVSLHLLDRFAVVAAALLGRPVLPGRAKGTIYLGNTGWHRDSDHPLPGLGFLAYLEPLTARTGALRVVPGSHTDLAQAFPEAALLEDLDRAAGDAVETEPGDVIAFDEHLIHGSVGGVRRLQWRVDYIADPCSTDEEQRVRAYYAQILADRAPPAQYDSTRYPSYGDHWQSLDRSWTHRLRELGVYERAKNR
jgi:ectoine hydroxylase-related dioxygenase (phytanoyl-CoA dioxygenase family)